MIKTDVPVWLITGCSSGLGRALALLVIDKGWSLIATARDKSKILDLNEDANDRLLVLELDVTNQVQIESAVRAGVAKFGRIDVLVNNAGYGYQSTAEEGVEAEIRAQFDVNVFGLFALTREVLPLMRAQHSGLIINVSSVAGLIGYPGSGYYAASKHAVEGYSDSLKAEVEPLGIDVTCVEPGPFRTEWAGRSLRQTRTQISGYEMTAGRRHDFTREISGTQAGDPVRAAQAMIALSQMDKPPRHLPLGALTYKAVVGDRRERLTSIEGLRSVSEAADYPP